MPKLPQPNYPQGEYPYLSPNPNAHESLEDGGRGTPVIVNTPPKIQQEGGIDPSILDEYAKKSDLPQGEISIDFNGTATSTTEALQRVVVGTKTYTVSSGMSNPMTTAGDLIVGASNGTPSRLGVGSAGKLLASTGSALAYTDSLPYLTTAPSAANADGLKIVVLDEEPATYYDGYYYIITEANQ